AEHCRLLLRLGRRTPVLRPVARLLALAVALLAGDPMRPPRATRIAARLHGHLVQRADRRRPMSYRARARRRGRWRTGPPPCLGGWRRRRARGGVRGLALLAQGVEQRLPLPRLV